MRGSVITAADYGALLSALQPASPPPVTEGRARRDRLPQPLPPTMKYWALLFVGRAERARGSFLPDDSVLATAKRTSTVVYAVSDPPVVEPLRGGIVRRLLRDLCDFTGGRVLKPSATNLGATFLTMVKLKSKRGSVRARRGYQARG